MNTVAYGLEFGKDIYCVPSLATNNSGCNMLIKQGAYLLESADDLIAIKKDYNKERLQYRNKNQKQCTNR